MTPLQSRIAEIKSRLAPRGGRCPKCKRPPDDVTLTPGHAPCNCSVTDIAFLTAALERACEALEFYSGVGDENKVIQWGKTHVCNSYSGGAWLPDWNADLQDEPGEIAQRALTAIAKLAEGE